MCNACFSCANKSYTIWKTIILYRDKLFPAPLRSSISSYARIVAFFCEHTQTHTCTQVGCHNEVNWTWFTGWWAHSAITLFLSLSLYHFQTSYYPKNCIYVHLAHIFMLQQNQKKNRIRSTRKRSKKEKKKIKINER